MSIFKLNKKIRSFFILLFSLISFFILASCGVRDAKDVDVHKSEFNLPLESSELLTSEVNEYALKLDADISHIKIGELTIAALKNSVSGLPDDVKGVCVTHGRQRFIGLIMERDRNTDLSIILHELGHCAFNLPHPVIKFGWPYYLIRGHFIPKHVMYPHFILSNKIVLACEDVFIKNLKTGEEITREELKDCLQNISDRD